LRDELGNPKKVVVVSGYGIDGLLTETEILDLEIGVWSQGPPVQAFAAGKYYLWCLNTLFNWLLNKLF